MASDIQKITQQAIWLLQKGQSIDIVANGRSMFPWLLPGYRLRVQPYKTSQIKRGDIVVFNLNAQLIAHRVIQIKPEGIICRGDAIVANDSLVEFKSLLGKVTHYQPPKGKFKNTSTFKFRLARTLALYAHPLLNSIWLRLAPYFTR